MGGARTVAGVGLSWGAATDVGRVRSVNEDSLLADAPVFLVADGMGGHEAGDVASALAVDSLARLVGSEPDDPDEVSRVIGQANEGILAASQSSPEERGMGTTAVGLVLLASAGGAVWMLFNIGDSRIYRLAEGRLTQLSTDHSYVQELIDAGRITPSAALTHPQRNVVTRALGVEDHLEVDLWLRPPVPGERFLLCSDGLSGELPHAAIQDLLGRDLAPDETCVELVDRALSAGGSDNITAVVVDVDTVDGFGVEDSNTNPRDALTREIAVVPPIAPESPRGVDLAAPLEGSSPMIEVPAEIAETPEEPGPQHSTLIAGIPISEDSTGPKRNGEEEATRVERDAGVPDTVATEIESGSDPGPHPDAASDVGVVEGGGTRAGDEQVEEGHAEG